MPVFLVPNLPYWAIKAPVYAPAVPRWSLLELSSLLPPFYTLHVLIHLVTNSQAATVCQAMLSLLEI